MDKKAQLTSVRNKIKNFVGMDDLSDEQVKELESLNREAVKLEALISADEQAFKAQAEADKAESERIQARIDEALKAKEEEWKAEAAKGRRLPFEGNAPHQAQFADTSKYDGMSTGELALAITFMNSTGKIRPSLGAYKALAIKAIEDKGDTSNPELSAMYTHGAMKAAGLVLDKDAYKDNGDAFKAVTDPMYTGGSTDGGNWVHTAYSRELWQAIRSMTQIVSKIPKQVIPDGYSSATIPIEGTDFTWYSAPEASSTDATLLKPAQTISGTQITTPTNREITVGKMGATGWYTGELSEDSIIAFVPQARKQLEISGTEQLEHLVLDGDTETSGSTNINDIGGTPTATGTNRDLFLLLNGFRKLPLVTNTDNARAGGSLDEDDYLETMWLMGTAGLAGADMSKCSFIVDPNVYKKSLQMAVVKTKDVWSNATVESGVLTKLWGYEILPSWFMHYKSAVRKANTAGKVDQDTVANNTTGSILGVRWDQWKFAYKRLMTVETVRVADADAYQLVAWMRVGMNYRDTEASAITYGLSV